MKPCNIKLLLNRPVFRSFSLFHVLFSLTFCYSTICLLSFLIFLLSLLFLNMQVLFILYMIFQICTFSCKANIYLIPSFSRSYSNSVYSLSFCLLFSEWRGRGKYLLLPIFTICNFFLHLFLSVDLFLFIFHENDKKGLIVLYLNM